MKDNASQRKGGLGLEKGKIVQECKLRHSVKWEKVNMFSRQASPFSGNMSDEWIFHYRAFCVGC